MRLALAELSARLARTPVKDVYVFVHGYNNDFQNSVVTIAQLWHFLGRQGVPIAYSWPAGHGGLLRGYTYDRESGVFTVYHLKQMLRVIAACPDVRKAHLIAHSRRTAVLTSALRELLASQAFPPMALAAARGSVRRVNRSANVNQSANINRSANVNRNVNVNQNVNVNRNVNVHGDVKSLSPKSQTVVVQNATYYYADGVYYQQGPQGYVVIPAPSGAVINDLPPGAVSIVYGGTTYYYSGGVFYSKKDALFLVVNTPIGITVSQLPPGANQTQMNGESYFLYNGIYYKPAFQNGVTVYTTVKFCDERPVCVPVLYPASASRRPRTVQSGQFSTGRVRISGQKRNTRLHWRQRVPRFWIRRSSYPIMDLSERVEVKTSD